jgi:putative peptidoglycan lipid II flippase
MAQSVTRSLSNTQIIRAALVVLLGFFTSGILGLLRTAIFSAAFGTSTALDAFYAAQRIPEMLFVLVAGGALGSSFIPVFARFLNQEDKAGAWRLASAVMTLSALAAAALSVLLILFAPQIVPALLVPYEQPAVQALTVQLTQIMMLTVVIFSISGLLMGILNAHQLFLLPALAVSMNNIGLIIGALVISRLLSPVEGVGQSGDANIYGLAVGAVLGALLHLTIQLPGMIRIRARLRFSPDWRIPGALEVLSLMGPRVLGLGVVQINFVVNTALTSGMAAGSLTALTTAWTLTFFTLGVVAQSIATAVFPSLCALAADADLGGFKDRMNGALRSVIFLALPATVGLIVFGVPIIRLFERGEWTSDSTAATAWALAFYALGIVGFGALEILSRAFYALSDTWTPVRVGVLAMVSNIVLSLVFIQFIGDPGSLNRGSFAGLALANALTTLGEALLLWWLLRRRIGALDGRVVFDAFWRAGAASIGMGLAVGAVGALAADLSPFILAPLGAGIGGVVFFALSLALRIEEARTVPNLILRRFRR